MPSGLSQFRACKDVVSAELDGEQVLLNLETGLYYGLDEIGSSLWNGLCGGRLEAALDELAARYDVSTTRLRSDAEELLGRLAAEGLVRRV